jgi:catechol 2,3-dioxygenase-like lactoylglutathione lyase family enzyme/ketosteroid isomerase-like protein
VTAEGPHELEGWEPLSPEQIAGFRGFEPWDRNDIEAWIDRFSSDCEFRAYVSDQVEDTVYRGHQGLREFWQAQKEVWEDTRHTIERAWRRGQLILVLGRQHARGKASGVEVELPVVFLSERDEERRVSWSAQYVSIAEALDAARRRESRQVEINGVAHIQLSVNDFARCVGFYDQLMPYLGLRVVHRSDDLVYYVGGRTGFALSPADPRYAGERHVPTRSGLHHLCFRARSREDIDDLYVFLEEIGAEMVRAPEEGPWAPGYYSLSFLDPEGIRLEVNHVPGKGVFAEDATFDPARDYPVTGRPSQNP